MSQRRLLRSAMYPLTTMYRHRKRHASLEHTQATHEGQSWHGDARQREPGSQLIMCSSRINYTRALALLPARRSRTTICASDTENDHSTYGKLKFYNRDSQTSVRTAKAGTTGTTTIAGHEGKGPGARLEFTVFNGFGWGSRQGTRRQTMVDRFLWFWGVVVVEMEQEHGYSSLFSLVLGVVAEAGSQEHSVIEWFSVVGPTLRFLTMC